jgi:hypothetical protein
MLKALVRRHRGLAGAVSLLGAVALVAGIAGPAYGAGSDTGPTGGNNASGNYNIYQGGSNTTYIMMNGLATLFNESPGCDLSSFSSQQPLDYGCPGINDLGGSYSTGNNPSNVLTQTNVAVGENGFSPFATENPFNDVLIEEPPIGSGNGIKELEEQLTHAPVTTFTVPDVTVTSGSDTITAAGTTTFAAVVAGDIVSGADQGIPSTAVACDVTSTSITLLTSTCSGAADNASATGTFSVTFSTASTGANVAPLDVARSSRAPNLTVTGSAGDNQGLNFVAYAMDGVSWIHWTAAPPVGGGAPTATPSASVDNLSIANLQAIFEGTLSCSLGGTTVTMNWACVNGATTAPSPNTPNIVVYWAQNGSGTEATWANMLYGTSNAPNSYYPTLATNHIIFENETESIVDNGDEANAIFFFSYGKYNTVCTPTAGFCGSEPTGWASGSTLALGQIAGSTVDQASIASQLPGGTTAISVPDVTLISTKAAKLAAPAAFPAGVLVGDTVADTTTPSCIPSGTTVTKVKSATKVKLSAATTCNSTTDTVSFTPPAPFPGDRLLYNVYSDGLSAKIPASSLASLNVVSEDGFMCKPSTASDVDPNTGDFYRTEIDTIITANGFYPLPLAAETGTYTAPSANGGPYGASAIQDPAWTLPAVTTGSEVGGLGSSGYANNLETGQPYEFPAADTDTDDSAVSGSHTINGSSVTATPTNPVGYCLVLSTDGNSTP